MRRKLLIYAGAIAIFFVIAAATGTALFFSPLLTHYIESDAFRVAMENKTAKGLHFPSGRYAPIRRTGAVAAQSEGFQASDGEKAIKSLNARGITARFNPWAVFFRRWEVDEVHVQSGEIELQIYEHKPEPVLSNPWFSIFLPNRVLLKRIESDAVNVTWRLRGERAGFFGTRLLITPNGSDFEYRANGGILKMAVVPDLYLARAHLLITKTLLTVYDVDLTPNPQSEGGIRAQGNAGIGEDKSVDLKATFERLPIRPWLQAKWKEHLSGSAFGEIHWTGVNPKLESSSGEGALRVRDGRIDNLPLLEKLAEVARNKSFEHLQLNDCSLSFAWRYPKIDIKDIAIEEKGKFRIEGAISINHRSLHGAISLGLTHQYLDWLPNPQEVFSRERSGYLWTSVHLSGTIDEPKQDLSPRIVELFKESPGAYLGLLFRQFEDWLKRVFGGD
ncbi:MAG: hypothetical protein DMF37_10225 [Verrucomicrobia bacterium]|nr:MAG: hypothetical protein DMF37_10225 [Verrucomicrobiota bacterium]